MDLRDEQIILTFHVGPNLSDDERDDLTTACAMVIADFADATTASTNGSSTSVTDTSHSELRGRGLSSNGGS